LLAQEREAVVSEHHEHSFLLDFQPIKFGGAKSKGGALAFTVATTALNVGALFGVFYVIGCGLRMGLGL
jgi:hypothetical protein